MARRLSSLFETPGATAHAAYAGLLILMCFAPLILLRIATHTFPITRPALYAAFAVPTLMICGFGLLYGPVRYRIRRLLNGCDERAVLYSPCLILMGAIEQPGVAEVLADRLILVPLVGRCIEIPLHRIESITPSHWFNGADFQSLTGFLVECTEWRGSQLGFAVPDGDAWQAVLPHVTPPPV